MKLGQTSLFMESMEYTRRSNHQRWTPMGLEPYGAHPMGWRPGQGLPLGHFGKREGGVPTQIQTPLSRFGKRGEEFGQETKSLSYLVWGTGRLA
jgi:hypothetical protein